MQFKEKQGEMSSKEAMNMDGSKRKGRAQKVGSVWESRIMVNQLKTAEENNQKIRTSSSVSNAEVEVDKQSSCGASGKTKTVEIARHRSDLGINKTPLHIKRTRSAVTATSVRDETNLVKLRKLKSDSAKVAANHSKSLPLQLVEAATLPPTNLVDQHATKSDDEKTMVAESDEDLKNNQVKAITNNADHVEEEGDDEKEEEEEEEVEKEMEVEVEVEKKSVDSKDIVITPQEQKPKKVVIGEKKKLLHSNNRSPPITPIVKQIAPAGNHARIHSTPAKLNPSNDHYFIFSEYPS